MDDIRMKFPIVMFVGKLGSGKDTAAQMMRDRVVNGDSVTLAAPMKEFAKKVFGFTHEQMYGSSKLREDIFTRGDAEVKEAYEETWRDFIGELFGVGWANDADRYLHGWFEGIMEKGPRTGRHILQTLGTEFGRTQGRDLWIDYGIKNAQNKLVSGSNLVTITDGRFRNEVLAVKKIGGMVIHVINPDDTTIATHASEKEQESIPPFWYDYRLVNRKSMGLLNLKHLVDSIQL